MCAAIPLFAAKGYDALTTKEIADAAGVSEALLYRHFDSKQVLYDEIQASCIARAATDARRLEELPDSTSTLILATYMLADKIQRRSDEPHPERNEMCRLLLRSLLDDGRFAAGFMAETSAPWVSKVERCVQAAIAAGDLEETVEGGCMGVWFVHHLSVAINIFSLPADIKIVPYPVDDGDVFDHSVRFCLRGMGLTAKAIARHYNPKAFALMRSPRTA